MNSPVVIFVYNRPLHTKEMLKSLNQCRGCGQTELFIYADGPKTSNDTKVNEVRAIIHNFEKNNQFASVNIIESDRNRGLAASVISGVTSIIERYGRVIVLEDDLVVSDDFLEYMNEALAYYEDYPKVWSIAGYSPKMPAAEKSGADVYVCLRAGSWGWATWKDRWDMVDWDVSDYDIFRQDRKKRKAFDRRSPGMTKMLDMQMNGEIDSWAIRWCYTQFKEDMYTINPTYSRIKNLGVDGSGTHGVTSGKWDVELKQMDKPIEFGQEKKNQSIIRQYNRYFSRSIWERIQSKCKRILGVNNT